MKVFLAVTAACFIMLATLPAGHAADAKIAIVAAENFYGDVARQIGGDRIAVTSIMSNPDQDPHLFEVSPAIVARSLRRKSSSTTAPITIRGWKSCLRRRPIPSAR